jgi:hypothetical protein
MHEGFRKRYALERLQAGWGWLKGSLPRLLRGEKV